MASEKDLQIYGLGLPEDIVHDLLPEEKDKTPDLIERRVKQRLLLNIYINTGGQIVRACEETGISYNNYKSWMKRDEMFALAVDEARKATVDILESEMIRRGFEGYEEPLHYKGKLTGDKIKKYSDDMLKQKLRQLDPSYKDANQTNIGIMGKDLRIKIVNPKDK